MNINLKIEAKSIITSKGLDHLTAITGTPRVNHIKASYVVFKRNNLLGYQVIKLSKKARRSIN
jgi:hypothetical protein